MTVSHYLNLVRIYHVAEYLSFSEQDIHIFTNNAALEVSVISIAFLRITWVFPQVHIKECARRISIWKF